jgi:alkanesulfonate monooxygenase SsuD/methylene tetrahydromethanopterin reductase-like flavin-dependent oxidoreductase (luciferase family)
VAIGVWAVCAESEEEARHLATSIDMAFAMLRRGSPIPLPRPEVAERFLRQHDIGPGGNGSRRRIAGPPEGVRAQIEEVAAAYGADEVILITVVHDLAARRRSFELVAEAFGLGAALPAPQAAGRGSSGG